MRSTKPTKFMCTKPTKFMCSYKDCGKSFQSRYRLQQHRQLVGHKRVRKTQSSHKLKQIQLDLAQPTSSQSVQDDCTSSDLAQAVQEDSPSEAEVESCESQCPMCELYFDDDIANLIWVECTNCSKWMHTDCIPASYPSSPCDEDFTCVRYF